MVPSEPVTRVTDVVGSARMIGTVLADGELGTVDRAREQPVLLILPGADDVLVSWEEGRVLVALADLDDRGGLMPNSTALLILRSGGS